MRTSLPLATSSGAVGPRAPSFRFWLGALTVALLALAMLPSAGPAMVDPDEPVVLSGPLRERVRIRDGWRYHPGDDAAWAAPSLDDAQWPVVTSRFSDPSWLPGGWPGIGWFRRRLMLAEGMASTAVALRLEQAGAADIYLDGRLITSFGTVSATAAAERPFYPNHFVGIALEPGAVHVLAIRYSNSRGNVVGRGSQGFVVNLRSVEAAAKAFESWAAQTTAQSTVFAGAFGALALLHLLLWAFHPRSTEHLCFAAFAIAMATQLALTSLLSWTPDIIGALRVYRPLTSAMVASVLTGLAVEHVLFRHRPGVLTWLVGGAGVAVAGWVWTWNALHDSPLPQIYFIVGLLEMLRVAVAAVLRREPDAWIVAAVLGPLTVVTAAHEVAVLLGISFPSGIVVGVPLLVLLLGFSVYISGRAGRTARALEAKLLEVQRLSEQAIENERRAAQEAVERQLLTAANERKARELDEARQLQLAMLPRTAPALDGYDIAFRMLTATEVGGDYIDTRADGGGSTLLAVGDATSHGLRAGMVVALTKSLFQSAPGGERPAALLHRIGTALEATRDRRASIAMAILRLSPGKIDLASAGMQPLLVLRRDGVRLEEILLSGTPLATFTGARYDERAIRVEPADTVLAMTDGLVEATNPTGEAFGYDRVATLLMTLAGRSANAVADGMIAGVTNFLAGQPPQDDITVVALVAR
jgi:serine phosphatase RsbU (regulator of sigma subunit)